MRFNVYRSGDLEFVEVSNETGLKVTFCNLGASIYKIHLDRYLLTRNVNSLFDYKFAQNYYGKTIGRVSNRFKGPNLKIGDTTYRLKPNEDNGVVLHGGVDGLSTRKFNKAILSYDDKLEVSYSYLSAHKESGFPGNLLVTVTYTIYKDKNELEVSYKAKADKDTPVSLTNHTYFTLANTDILPLYLRINSHKYLKTDESLLPLEEQEVTPCLDFSNSKRIVDGLDDPSLHTARLNGYDHFFYFDEKNEEISQLTLNNSKIQLDIFTDFEGVQIYTHGFASLCELYPKCQPLFNSVAIEPSDSFFGMSILKTGEVYKRFIKYKFTYKE